MNNSLSMIFAGHVSEDQLWDGRYKIPWDDLAFSTRMLSEHLSQEHDLASRRTEIITAQAVWIHENVARGVPACLLDMGCGPGLHLRRFLELGYECTGIDFSPASVEYARKTLSGKVRLIKDDLRAADFCGGYDVAIMLFGELNVFSPDDCARILAKAYDALVPGGVLVLEVHAFDVVKRCGLAPDTWYKSGEGLQGLFSDAPHLCLTENHWFESCRTALQVFHIVNAENGGVESFRSTIKAWTNDEYRSLLETKGFCAVAERSGWPSYSDDFLLITAVKSAEING